MIRLIALDLDGTLLNSALKVSERNGEAVRRALESGLNVVLATTRWYLLAKRTADRLGIDTPLVCNNGAIVKRPGDGSELLNLRLDQELAREVTALADERGWEAFTTIEDVTYMRPRPGIIPEKLPAGLRISERQSDEVARGQPTAVLVYGQEAVDEIAGRFMEAYDGRAEHFGELLASFPRLTVVMAHLAFGDFAACAELARAHQNVFFDCCFVINGVDRPPAVSDEEAVAAFRQIGTDRVMFGSDFPWFDPVADAERIRRLPLTDTEKRAILHDNAARILSLDGTLAP